MNEIQLYLKQNGYLVLEDNRDWKNRFEVKSYSSGNKYTIAQRKSDDTWGCGCKGWISNRHCKHLKDIAPLLANMPKPKQIS